MSDTTPNTYVTPRGDIISMMRLNDYGQQGLTMQQIIILQGSHLALRRGGFTVTANLLARAFPDILPVQINPRELQQ